MESLNKVVHQGGYNNAQHWDAAYRGPGIHRKRSGYDLYGRRVSTNVKRAGYWSQPRKEA
jgi:hypothetical protein